MIGVARPESFFFRHLLSAQWGVNIFEVDFGLVFLGTPSSVPYTRHYNRRFVYFLPHFSDQERLILQTI